MKANCILELQHEHVNFLARVVRSILVQHQRNWK